MKIAHFNGQNVTTKDNKVICSKTCTVSGDTYIVTVNRTDYETWRDGALIQNVFPLLSTYEREFLITGYTPSEWDKFFPEEED